MNNDKHYNPHILRQLAILTADDVPAERLVDYLSHLSNAQFRTAGYLLGERLLPEVLPSRFWLICDTLTTYNAKAFLVTLMKSVAARLQKRDVSLHDEGFLLLASRMEPGGEDCRKTLLTLLPVLDDADTVCHLFRSLGMNDQSLWIPALLRCRTLPSYYVLFLSLRHLEHRDDFIRRTIIYLIDQGDSLSFNLASLLRTYFGFDDIRGTFSLRLAPYQLSRIESSYEAFCKTMQF
jgi:hypothetical protein